jgi:hypothetical protein
VSRVERLDEEFASGDQDAVTTLRDLAEEAGGESESRDLFSLDITEARSLGVDLDEIPDEAQLS